MTTEKIIKIARRQFKDLDIDDMEEPCMVHIDNILENRYVIMLRLFTDHFDENDPHFIVFGGSEGGAIYHDKLFTNYSEATDYFYYLIEKTM